MTARPTLSRRTALTAAGLAALGLAVFYQENSTQWNLLMAAITLMTIPVIALFLYGQRFFSDGIAAGAVKQ